MSDDSIEVLLVDGGDGVRYAIPTSELAQYRLPEGVEVDESGDSGESDVEGFMLTQQFFPHSSSARVRYPRVFDKSMGWAPTVIGIPKAGGPARPR